MGEESSECSLRKGILGDMGPCQFVRHEYASQFHYDLLDMDTIGITLEL